MTTSKKKDVRRFKMVRTSPAIIEPGNRRLIFDAASFRGPTPSAPVLNNHINLTSHVAGRILTAWADRLTGSILGDIEIYPDSIQAAADVRQLLAAGHRGASINYEAGRRQPNQDGSTGIFDWEIGHLAIVGQGADPAAGPMDLSADGTSAMFNLEILAQEDDMTTPPFDLATVLPQLTDAIAAGVRQGNAQTDTGGQGPEQMSAMLQIAASQPELYKPGALQELGFDLVLGKFASAEDFRAKLASIQIISRPQASGLSDAEMSEYDLSAVVRGIMANDMSGMSKELSLSNEIRRGSEVASRLSPNAIAVPLRELASHSGTTGTGASGTSVQEQTVAVFDSTVPDSTDILPYVTRVPTGPGFAKSVAVTVPTPSHVEEPGDTGYSKTGDAVGVGTDMVPHLLVDYMLMTRVLQVLEPEFEGNVLEIVMRRFMEAQNRALVVGDTVNSPFENGLYGHAGIGSSADLTAVVTTDDIEEALASSIHVAGQGAGRAIITSATTVTAMRQLAQPTAVSALMSPTPAENGEDRIRDVRVFTTGFFPAANPYRGVVGPWADCLMKEWDGSMYVSRRYEAGINTLLTELFWDARIMHPSLFHRFRQD